jgi:hypothetical protein
MIGTDLLTSPLGIYGADDEDAWVWVDIPDPATTAAMNAVLGLFPATYASLARTAVDEVRGQIAAAAADDEISASRSVSEGVIEASWGTDELISLSFTPTARVAPDPTPTPEPTATPTVAPVSYTKLTARGWAKIVKAPDNYIGKGYQIWGCISQFDAATGDDTFRAQAYYAKTQWWWLDGSNAMFSGSASRLADFVQDDAVFMKVLSMGSYTYDTQAGGSTTVPMFLVVSISHKGTC